jgi:DNA-binding response OmpR family regulator
MLRLLKPRARVLLLDDDASIQKLISILLRRNGYAVDVVSSGALAIEHIARTSYVAMLLDLMTPTEGGLTVIKHLREKKPALLSRVILVTASPDSVLRSIDSDVKAVVRKPFQAEELLATVRRVAGV